MILEEPESLNTLFTFFRAYQDGYLPFPGALTNQPNVLVEALMEISATKAALDAEDDDKARDGNDNSAEGGSFKSVLKRG